jgi:gamma-glutamylcyclotransferase (GGCT)/AIG2-like uncharacterized protein YtfP
VKVGDNILVYGTLKHGFGANSVMQGRSEFVGEDRVNGKIYGLGGFPGFIAEAKAGAPFHPDEPAVTGEVYLITDENLPEMLDNYEGYPRLYGRSQYRTEEGRTVWVYEYNSPIEEYLLIPSGVWEGHTYVAA